MRKCQSESWSLEQCGREVGGLVVWRRGWGHHGHLLLVSSARAHDIEAISQRAWVAYDHSQNGHGKQSQSTYTLATWVNATTDLLMTMFLILSLGILGSFGTYDATIADTGGILAANTSDALSAVTADALSISKPPTGNTYLWEMQGLLRTEEAKTKLKKKQ